MFYEPLKPNMGPLVLRLGLATILLVHGGLKLFYGPSVWFVGLQEFLQVGVAWAELITGALLLVGFLTRFVSVVVAAIQVGAIALVTGKLGFVALTIRSANEPVGTLPFQTGWEYNFALIIIAAGLFFLGSGALSVDDYLWRHRKKVVPAVPPLQPVGGVANPV
jgi:uncharacterized membrane protein YphA (DoxX/SURF4 family)